MGAKVSPEKLEVTWFTDSDHSIRYNQQGQFLYRQLSETLYAEKRRQGNSNGGHQWSKKALAKKFFA